ncbi:hypothetical protein ATCM_03100 [Stenotrophomonas sp. ATCM1_4]|uniref:LamG-like jellyroll fold domain-containing protein n=1 Tax=Stenotrophomonas sp. ATCM1_4 TaxID=2259330 RepID=UPI001049582A|nr:LamG-like jellyroll fold domain-containing protein [Stenotrophomonas sp. ATCM1_4]TDB26722.1 hypothetical protein ATCM_03100 [Stenotrophomonas sp. ATCM1_4]
MSSILSLRPDLDQNVDALPLFIAGALPSTRPAIAYEGRLSIRNPAGPCTVEQVGGDSLPPGSSLSVDNATKQVVLAWPAYSEYVTPLENPGFETGDTSGWSFTPRGGGGVPVVDSAYRYEGAHSLRWPGGRGMGSEGGIEVEAWNNTIAPCLPGRRVTIHTRCMYNPAGHHFGSRYQGLIRFLDSMGNPIGSPARGKQFKGRGNNGRWNDASATAVGPAGTAGVQLGAWLTGSEAATWLDAASWDVPSAFGINAPATIQLVLRVRDSAGRTALWSGSVTVSAADPIAVSILAKLTCFWPFESTSGATMSTTQADVLGTGPENAVLRYGSAPAVGAGRTGSRSAPMMANCGYATTSETSKLAAGAGDYCMFGWVRVAANPTNDTGIMCRYDSALTGSSAGAGMRFKSSGAVQGWFSNGTADRAANVAGPFPLNQWAFVLSQRRNNLLKTSVNNSAFSSEISVVGDVPRVGNLLYFGCSGDYFKINGRVQDFGWIKGESLTDEEIAWLYNAGAGRTIEEIQAAAG